MPPEHAKAAYLALTQEELARRAVEALKLLKGCRLCPRRCDIDRTAGDRGFCGIGDLPEVASFGPHMGEEPPITGRRGSGTIFFAGCNLGCLFCQNWDISHQYNGESTTPKGLASIMLNLQALGCHNINLVTPTHQMPMALEALALAVPQGLTLPIVYNCGGYESMEALALLDGIVDIYMPDFKFWDALVGLDLTDAEDYPLAAREAIKEMHRQVGELHINPWGIAQRGLLVRHLVLPGGLAGSKGVFEFIARELSADTYINIMDQYYPCYLAHEHPPLDRRVTRDEYAEALQMARMAGLRRIAE